MSRGLRRHALGWEQPPLAAAADWLLAEHGADLSGVIVALPGGQAGRRLRELLARRAQRSTEAWVPPRILTQGALVDELVGVDLAVAPRFARTLAWDGALESLTAVQRARVARTPRGVRTARDLGERIRLAETVRALHGRLAPQGLDFGALASGDARPQSAGEAARWEALAAAQVRYRELLAEAGLADPHEARLQAIEAGRVACELDVVLVGVADMNRLLVKLLEQIAERATALIAAPAELLEGFDEWGRLRTEFWRERRVPIALDAWRVVEKPVDQAAAVRDVLASFAGRFAVDEVVVGVADEQVTPYLKQTLGACGAEVRDAAGTPLERTRPFRALQAAARYAARRTFSDLAALARHADVEPLLGGDVNGFGVVGALDDYHGRHLPGGVDGDWLGGPSERSQPVVANAHAALGGLLGELDTPRSGTLSNWVEPTLAFLRALFGDRRLDVEEVEADRVLAGALERIAEVLAELEELPAQLSGPEVAAHEALELVLRRLEGEAVPPAPPRPGEPAIELSGWLELPLEDAPALIVTGFQDRHVPGSVQGDAFLPDGACRALGLPNNDDRLARDAYATTLIVETRPCAAFVTGRRSHEGDPHVPSRLAFQVGEDEVVERVRHFLAAAETPLPPPGDASAVRKGLARLPDAAPVESMSVTSFRAYLESPYRFYLERALRLRSIDDRARELDPLGFGNLAHEVLEGFGNSDLCDCADAERIRVFLDQALHQLAARRFGERPLPAVALQVEQLSYRLRFFAQAQAQRAAEGWTIAHVEWVAPKEKALLDVDGVPMLIKGKIDRIDRHRDGRWAVWDYKTGENSKPPDKTHRPRGEWIDLQLPLYAFLTRALGYAGLPELGHVTLGKKTADVEFQPAIDWNEAVIDEALEKAREVVRCVRRGEFFENPGPAPKWDPLVAALFGVGLLDADDDTDGESAP